MYSRTEIIELANRENVRFIRLQFVDLFGVLKNVEIPIAQLEEALDGKIMFDGSSIQGFVRIEESDMYLKPDYASWLILPQTLSDTKVARLICSVCLPDGRPFAGDPRNILRRAIDEAVQFGIEPRVAVELEFFLLKQDAKGRPTTEPNDRGGYFDIAPTDAGENCRRDIVLTLERMGVPIATSHHETSPGQHEIDLGFTDLMRAADYITTVKLVARTLSRRHGLYATFMPKPLQDEDGSSMHCTFVLPEEHVPSYIAGLLFHAPAVTCITNPVVNSYKRLVPGFEAPSYIFWSTRHRTPFVRVSEGDEGTRVELRSPDSSCNPYLALAASLKAGIDGVRRRMIPPKPVYKSVSSMSPEERFRDGIGSLPSSLEQAIEALEENETMRDALGDHAFSHFVQAKLLEWQVYERTVHPWELQQYLEL